MTPQDFQNHVLILRSAERPDDEREAVLEVLQRAELIDEPDFPRAAYLALLRDLIADRSSRIRIAALTVLAVEGDPMVQDRLLAGLENVDSALTTRARTIRLLAYDAHGSHIPTCRRIAVDRNAALDDRIEALRALAADPQSEGRLEDIMSDRGDKAECRLWAGLALRALAPATFEVNAHRIIGDSTEPASVRQMCAVAFKTSPTLNPGLP